MTIKGQLKIGWAQTDITPDKPVLIAGQFHARISEGVRDPVTVTVLVLDGGEDHAVFVSCDLVGIADPLRDSVRSRLPALAKGLDPRKVVFNATHTHTAPELREPVFEDANTAGWPGVDLPGLMPARDIVAFAAERITAAAAEAWNKRAPGRVAFGQGFAVVGRNRRWVDTAGTATMYGNTDAPMFSHIEGYEDHSVNLLVTRDMQDRLTGLVINLACPSQETEQLYELSADYWCETRAELRKRLGTDLYILPQCSAAGDQSPHLIYEKQAVRRMLELKGRTEREEIGQRISNAVEETLAWLDGTASGDMVLEHRVIDLALPMNKLTEADVRTATAEAEKLRKVYEEEKARLQADPELRKNPRWYVGATAAYRRMNWFKGVAARFKAGSAETQSVEIHVIRLGDIVFATNPFEYYLDFGIHIKARSKAVQTFLVQLAGSGSYVPSARSAAGGGYGSIPASNPIGPEGGRLLARKTVDIINQLWGNK